MKNKNILLLISLILPFVMVAQESVLTKYEANFKKIKKTYTLNLDGSQEFNYFKEVQLLSVYAFNRMYGETFIVYNPDFQTLKINKAYTIMADGTRVDVPENAFNEVLPRNAANFPAFNQLREMVVTHTALDVGSTIFLDYTIISKPNRLKDLSVNLVLAEQVPVEDYEIEVRVPEDMSLFHRMLNLRLGPDMVNKDGMKVFTWKYKGAKATVYEQDLLPDAGYLPTLSITTFKDMHRAYDFLCNQDAFRLKNINGAQSLIDSLLVTTVGEVNQMLAIQKYVVSNISYKNIPLELSAFQVETGQQVWDRNVGTKTGKAVLLASLLQQAGFSALPIAISYNQLYHKDMGCLNIFDDFGVRVITEKGERLYFSPTHKTSNSLDVVTDNMVAVPLDPNVESLRHFPFESKKGDIGVNGFLTIDMDAAVLGNLDVKLRNSTNPWYQFVADKDYGKAIFSNGITSSGVSNISRKKCEKTNTELKIDIDQKNSIEEVGGYYFWDIPSVSYGSDSWHLDVMPTERIFPMELTPIRETYSYDFVIPDGFELVTEDVNLEKRQSFGTLKIHIYTDGAKVYVTRNLNITEKSIVPMHYENFRKTMILWNNKTHRQLILKRK